MSLVFCNVPVYYLVDGLGIKKIGWRGRVDGVNLEGLVFNFCVQNSYKSIMNHSIRICPKLVISDSYRSNFLVLKTRSFQFTAQ